MGIYFVLMAFIIVYIFLFQAAWKAPPPKSITSLDNGVRIITAFACMLCLLLGVSLLFTDIGGMFDLKLTSDIYLGFISLHSVSMVYTLNRSQQPQ